MKIPHIISKLYKSLRAYALRSPEPIPKPKPVTTKEILNLILDGIAIISIMFLIEYIMQEIGQRQYTGLLFPPVVFTWLIIKYIENRRRKK